MCVVIAGHSASEDARERAYNPAIHPLERSASFRWMRWSSPRMTRRLQWDYYLACEAARSTEAAVWPNRIARSSGVRMPPMFGLTAFAFS